MRFPQPGVDVGGLLWLICTLGQQRAAPPYLPGSRTQGWSL